jgi:hypothetical protein
MGRVAGVVSRVRGALPTAWAVTWQWVLIAAGVACAVYLLLEHANTASVVTAAALAALIVGVVLTWSVPLAIALMAAPIAFVTERLALGGADLTVSDAALAAGFGTVVLLGSRRFSPPLRAMLWLNAIYQFSTLFTVIANPYPQNTVEWFHAWLLISGALVVGWGLGRAGYARLSAILLLAMLALIAAGTFATAALNALQGHGLDAVYPVWPWPMHKNAAGGALALGVFLAYARPDWLGLARRWTVTLVVAFGAALLLTQSRQAIAGLLAALFVLIIRRGAAGHALFITILAVPAVVLIVQSVIEQFASGNEFNSAYARLDWMREVYALWKLSPIFGHGLRYWYVHPWAHFQPPQAELEVAASAGVVGLLGFAIMWGGFVVVLWRVAPRYGAVALGAVVLRITAAQFDLFWVAAQVSVPFLIAGICLGAQALAVSRGEGRYWAPPKDARQSPSERRAAARRSTAEERRERRLYDLAHSSTPKG